MQFDSPFRHPWPTDIGEARSLQQRLRRQVETCDRFGAIRRVAGVDIGLDRHTQRAHAAVVVLDYADCQPLEQATAHRPLRLPYIPGYLSFREAPSIMAALEKLTAPPDLIICDGQGIAHPRRFGLACHIGLLTDIPTIGAAKSRLIGRYREPGPDKGDWSELEDGDETVGAVLRTRHRVRPIFVSVGHRLSLDSARRMVLACCRKYRLPETTRAADRLASGDGKYA